jgi:hypothetical protein
MARLFDLLFGCPHRCLTRPMTTTERGGPRQTYVVCLDCGRRLAYDPEKMRVGKQLDR